MKNRRGIILYLDYRTTVSVPSSELAHRPLSRKRVFPSLGTGEEGGQHSLAGERAGGAKSDDWRESLALVYSV